jgi:cytochrome c biogenesis protein CcmG/thiol:disulfide interchange protein DsbE
MTHEPANRATISAGRPGRRAWWPLLAAAVVAIALVAIGWLRDREAAPGEWVGQRAPAVTLPVVGAPGAPGERVRVGQGAAALLFFWGPSCTVCKTVTPSIDALATEPPADVQIWTISGEDADDIRGYLKARQLRFGVLHDADYAAHSAWHVRSIPRTVVIDASGVVRFDHVGALTRTELDRALALLDAL